MSCPASAMCMYKLWEYFHCFSRGGRFPRSFCLSEALGIIIFYALPFSDLGNCLPGRQQGAVNSAVLLYLFYQENGIQTFLHKNISCCQEEWRGCVDDFQCREFSEIQPWTFIFLTPLLKLVCGEKNHSSDILC